MEVKLAGRLWFVVGPQGVLTRSRTVPDTFSSSRASKPHWRCATRVPEAVAHCPACARGVRRGTEFCPGCGQNLLAAVAAPTGSAGTPPAPSRESSRRFVEHWAEFKRLTWLFGLLLATSFVFGIAWRSERSPWLDVMMGVIDAVIILVVVAGRWPKLRFLFQVRPTAARDSMAMVGIAIVFVVLATIYFRTLEWLGVPMLSATAAFQEAEWPLWSMFLVISVMPAIFEELAFRGIIQSSLERMLNARDGWLIQAALFSVLHLSPLMFPSHFLMGLCFGYMRRRSRSLYPGMLLHGCWNALVVMGEVPLY